MFEDREHAGSVLAKDIASRHFEDPVVYALPRGGLPIGLAVARALKAPLDIILVRKLGAPGHAELAIGAIVDGASPALVLHEDIIHQLGVSQTYIENVKTRALEEIDRRRQIFLKGRAPLSPKGKTAIIVDDGLATGATMEVAVKAMSLAGAERIVVAVPVAPGDTIESMKKIADDVICPSVPYPFWSVGGHYRHFPQLTDTEVIDILSSYQIPEDEI